MTVKQFLYLLGEFGFIYTESHYCMTKPIDRTQTSDKETQVLCFILYYSLELFL